MCPKLQVRGFACRGDPRQRARGAMGCNGVRLIYSGAGTFPAGHAYVMLSMHTSKKIYIMFTSTRIRMHFALDTCVFATLFSVHIKHVKSIYIVDF